MLRIQDTIKLSTRMFRTRPARTWLTILGIGVGIAAVVVLVGLGYGLQGILLEKIVFGEAMLSLNVTAPASKIIVLDDNMVKEFLSYDNVQDVSPLASFPAVVNFESLNGSMIVQGTNAKYFSYAGLIAQKGRVLQDGDTKQIVITSATLQLFEIENPDEMLGKKMKFKVFVPITGTEDTKEIPLDDEFEVVGIIEDQSTISAYMPMQEFSSKFAIPYYEKARVKVSSSDFLPAVESKVLEKGFIVTALSKTVDQANKIFKGVQATLAVFGGIALIVSAIGMFNTMTVTLLERTKEIGIMRTIGGSPMSIKTLFITESVIMGFLGGLMGIGIGVGGGMTMNFFLNAVATRMGGTAISLFRFPISFLLLVAVFSAIMGFLTGIFPSKRAASLNPLDAIRYS
jgi:putative ABC transport system permease protein